MIIKTSLVGSIDAKDFHEKMAENIGLFQTEGLTVEIQYHPLAINSNRARVIYNALIIGRKQ